MMQLYPTETGGFIMTDLDKLPTCTLAKLRSKDGRWQYIKGKAFIGKRYKYSPASRETAGITHKPTGEDFICEIVLVYDERGMFCMMPTECLSFA